ncbi:SUMF1/EgtB/PvdO family nonheme iron enzyme [Armatimonas sp.]|uniref:formylglycine-generating enzyme family protein n=1 Tax=Armatimonas sp. TaxID=1872638 RepID=UPI00374D80FD
MTNSSTRSGFIERCKKYGLREDSTLDDVKSLRKNSARQFHPDVQFASAKKTANDKLAAINADCDYLIAYLEEEGLQQKQLRKEAAQKEQQRKAQEAARQEQVRKEAEQKEKLRKEQEAVRQKQQREAQEAARQEQVRKEAEQERLRQEKQRQKEAEEKEKVGVEALRQELLRTQQELVRVEAILKEQSKVKNELLSKEATLKTQLRATEKAPLTLAEYKAQLVAIPAGKFLRGSSGSNRSEDEKPQKEIYLSDYRIGRTPVTVGMYQEYCKATGKAMPTAPSWGWFSDHPMVNVSWDDAKTYADWAGLLLPTEAQWEKAARGTDGRAYPWGDSLDSGKCVNATNSNKQTAPVGKYPAGASPYGVLDMAGNVREWCGDWWADSYSGSAQTDPSGPSTGTNRILRGGSWYYFSAGNFRCAYRYKYTPDYRGSSNGFRLSSPGLR